VIVLDKSDEVVSREGAGDSLFLKACERCGLLVEHARVSRLGFTYAYVPLADHDSRCRP
jgi:hypothetical protein